MCLTYRQDKQTVCTDTRQHNRNGWSPRPAFRLASLCLAPSGAKALEHISRLGRHRPERKANTYLYPERMCAGIGQWWTNSAKASSRLHKRETVAHCFANAVRDLRAELIESIEHDLTFEMKMKKPAILGKQRLLSLVQYNSKMLRYLSKYPEVLDLETQPYRRA